MTAGFSRWKAATSGSVLEGRWAETRDRAQRIARMEIGPRLPHEPGVIWIPESFQGICLGCDWMSGVYGDAWAAAAAARRHCVGEGLDAEVVAAREAPVEVAAHYPYDPRPPADLPAFIDPDLSDPLGRIGTEREGE